MKPASCHQCNAKFGAFRWRHPCSFCNRTLCSSCGDKRTRVPSKIQVLDFSEHSACGQCTDEFRSEIAKSEILRMTVAAYEAGFKDGFAAGETRGRRSGLEEGQRKGQQDGYAKGNRDGYDDGVRDGENLK